jgi:hypothetical protein
MEAGLKNPIGVLLYFAPALTQRHIAPETVLLAQLLGQVPGHLYEENLNRSLDIVSR